MSLCAAIHTMLVSKAQFFIFKKWSKNEKEDSFLLHFLKTKTIAKYCASNISPTVPKSKTLYDLISFIFTGKNCETKIKNETSCPYDDCSMTECDKRCNIPECNYDAYLCTFNLDPFKVNTFFFVSNKSTSILLTTKKHYIKIYPPHLTRGVSYI